MASSGKTSGTKLGITKGVTKSRQFARWYQEVITKSEMIEYYDISGCYILRPWSYSIWESIQSWFDTEIKKLGVKNSYFPLFVTKDALEKEEDHIEGFAPEVAWVTKSGTTPLAKEIAIRPTSETIMYPAFAKWVQSHRDLPIRLNQWTSVVRWEFKSPTPFLRTREFLWQEGHSAFAKVEDADEEVLTILDLYARVYEELMAVPVIKGRKSEKEKFPGGRYTTTVEAFIPAAGRAIQGATSHSLGQNFAKMFDISYQAESSAGSKSKKEKAYAWQNSWGLTTRSIGVMVMVHGDDKGLVMPPRIAPVQVVVVWIIKAKMKPAETEAIKTLCNEIGSVLKAAGVRVEVDDRDDKTSAWKFNYWELRGVPVRIEVGARELKNGVGFLKRRDNNAKSTVPVADLATHVPKLLEQIQADMLDRARKVRDSRISLATSLDEFNQELRKGNLILTPWCELKSTEEMVKESTKASKPAAAAAASSAEVEVDSSSGEAFEQLSGAAKSLCIPFNQPPMKEGTMCFTGSGEKATAWCLWGRSY